MGEFQLQKYSGMQYSAAQTISFSQCPRTSLPNVDDEMQHHKNVNSVQVSCLTQDEFDIFATKYADDFQSIYFFQNSDIKDISSLACLRHTKYLLFYNLRKANTLWDMSKNYSLKGIMISDSKKLCYQLEPLQYAPSLEEFMLLSTFDRKHIVHSLDPIKQCKHLRRLWLNCNTEANDFIPSDFMFLDEFKYQVDKKRNYTL